MAIPQRSDWTLDDFLVWEAAQPGRYEFIDGSPRLMTGGTLAHSRISINIVSLLQEKLRGTPCAPGNSDVRVPIRATNQSRYPDASIYCGKFRPDALDAPEPVAVFEVLSKSNDFADQHGRLRDYDAVPSIRHYVVVAQDRMAVVTYDRDAAGRLAPGGLFSEAAATIDLPAAGISLPLAGVYEGLEFEGEAAASP
jgi:Uma2 family endonuclease